MTEEALVPAPDAQVLIDDLDNPKYYINRELGMLEFQRRVLEEAMDERNPLLERVKFLSIVGSNLDEFFMVRVGGLVMQRDAGIYSTTKDGLTPNQQLIEIRKIASKLMLESRAYWHNTITPLLEKNGIHILSYSQLTERQREFVNGYFAEVVYPTLTPLAFDPGHPFPHISNLSLNLAVSIQDEDQEEHFARVKVPASLPQLVPIKRSSGGYRRDGSTPRHHYFIWLSHLVKENIQSLFPGMKILEVHPFHVTRNADFEIQELEAGDLLEVMEESVRNRRFGKVIRLIVDKNMPANIQELLAQNLDIDQRDIYALDAPMNMHSLMDLYPIDLPQLKYRSFIQSFPDRLRQKEIFDGNAIFSSIRAHDILLHHPYDSFLPVVDFLRAAARDPNVLTIKMSLYRVGKNSPIVKTLLEARRDYGKQVAVLVELKARFDEESNIGWARMLEQEGVHVTYGLMGLKTHCKIALVVRKEGENIRRYMHLGTGNYHHITANLYEDMGLFTADADIGADASDVFNYLTGYSAKKEYRKLLIAPINLRQRFEQMIDREISIHKKKKNGHLIFKMNSLVDAVIIKKLYQASQVGVKVDLITRGICSLKPGIKGLSENIRVISILGRFLEHSRIYYFHNDGEEEIYLGSADLMPRNLNQRVEILFPVEDKVLVRQIRKNILELYLSDNVKARLMKSDGTYTRLKPHSSRKSKNAQQIFIERANRKNRTS
ncbi:MAG: polyphosphate kinase 1 [Anaerolineaceae bacterium]|jgi:polyphosphate kinase|nr:polyphosphate kinase 1 [Anaerolineaceae bacterium]